MTKKHNNVSTKWLSAMLVFIIVAAALFFVFILVGNQKSEDVTITGNATVTGVSCKNETLVSPLLVDVKANSYNNRISATFNDDKLKSISYNFIGTYDSNETAAFAAGMAAAKYNKTIGNYGVNKNAFSFTYSADGESFNFNLTADAGNLPSTAAPLFLLEGVSTFPNNLDAFVNAYEKEGFICEITK